MQKLVVNSQILLKFKSAQDYIEGTILEEYEAWIVQDQTVFICFLSIIF